MVLELGKMRLVMQYYNYENIFLFSYKYFVVFMKIVCSFILLFPKRHTKGWENELWIDIFISVESNLLISTLWR